MTTSNRSSVHHFLLFASLVILLSGSTNAQTTSATWNGGNATFTGAWSAAPWTVTSGSGTYPFGTDSTATFSGLSNTNYIYLTGNETLGNLSYSNAKGGGLQIQSGTLTLSTSGSNVPTFDLTFAGGQFGFGISTGLETITDNNDGNGLTVNLVSTTATPVAFKFYTTWSNFTGTFTLGEGQFDSEGANELPQNNEIVLGTNGNTAIIALFQASRNQSIMGLAGDSESSVINAAGSGAASTLTMGVNSSSGNTYDFMGSIGTSAGAVLGITHAGPDTQELSGTNLYTGPTSITAGTLQIGDGGTTGTLGVGGGVAISSGANLSFDRSDTAYSVSNVITGAGNVVQVGTGMTTLTGANGYSGATTINVGTLQVANATGSATGTSAVGVGGTGTSSGSYGTLTGGTGNQNSGTLYQPATANSPTLQNYQITGTSVGYISGSVTLNQYSHLAPGTPVISGGAIVGTDVGTLAVGNLTINSGSNLDYAFNGTANSFIVAGGTLTIGSGGVVNLYAEGTSTAFDTPGIYNLINYGILAGGSSASSLTVGDKVSGYTYTFTNDTTNGDNLIQLDIAPSATGTTYTVVTTPAPTVVLHRTGR